MEKRNLILLVPLILALTGAVFIVKGSIPLESRDPITINVGMNSKYKTIQSAVDAAIPGDKIVVENGTYSENVVVGIEDLSILGNGSVKIMAKDTGPALIVIMDDFIMDDVEIIGSRVGDVCFIRSNGCDIRDLHISGSGGEKFDSGINVKGKGINLQNINITNCSTGFLIQTVGLRDCPYGIAGDMPVPILQGGDWGGHILYCNASNNSGWGFFLRDCVNLTLGKCRSDDNMIGFQANNARRFQIVDCNASRNVRSGFIINASKEIWIPWMSSRENGDDGIVIQSCSWMCLDGGNFQGNARNGVNISGLCSDLYFTGMNITDNGGIGINCGFSGKKNAYYYINYNRFFSNDEYGIRVSRDCPMINISRNEFIDNNGGTEQAYSQSACAWYQTGGYDNVTLEGNHWSDWTSPDEDNDGIVDVPYNISGDSGTKDMYPIVERKMGYYDPYRSREWPGLDFLMEGSFFLCKVDPIKNPSEGYSSDQIDWYIEGEYIGTGDIFDFNPPSDKYTLTMQYKDPDGTYREISATFRHHYSENNSVLPRTTFIIGVVLLSISIALAILNVVILRKARKKDIEFSQNRFTIVENERNIFFEKGKDDIALIMDKAVESRTLKPKYSDLKRELDKKFASDQIDCDTYSIMIEILDRAYCQYPLSAW